jgi:hypothetical protein
VLEVCALLVRRVLVWVIRFTDTLYIQLGTTDNYSFTAISPVFTVQRFTRTRVLSLHWSNPGNGFITFSLSLQITYEFFFAPPNSFLAINLQLPTPEPTNYLSRCQVTRHNMFA